MTLVSPQPRIQKFLPGGDFPDPKPPLYPCGHTNPAPCPPPPRPPPPAPALPPPPPHPPSAPPPPQKFAELLWRLPRLPGPRVSNHTPPIVGPTHGVPRSPPARRHSPCRFISALSVHSSPPSALCPWWRACPLPYCPLPCSLPFSLPPVLPPLLPDVGHSHGPLACLPPCLYLLPVPGQPALSYAVLSLSDCTGALFSSSLLPFHLRSPLDPSGCQG